MTGLTHIGEDGSARMVDIGNKSSTARRAVAGGRIMMRAATLDAVREGNGPKGDVLSTARIAGIMAAKRTGELIPMCHPLALESVSIDFTLTKNSIEVRASASLTGRTGIEMEAMVAASVALLTIYDMTKALEKGIVIDGVRLLEKTGGKSGVWRIAE